MTTMASNRTHEEQSRVLIEEVTFFRSLGWDDREIADRLGVQWPSFLVFVKRHPQLAPVNDPIERARTEHSAWLRAMGCRS